MKVLHVVGAGPSLMKVGPFIQSMADEAATQGRRSKQFVAHARHHHAPELSERLFGELGLSKPDINLNLGSGSCVPRLQAEQMQIVFYKVLKEHRPDLMIEIDDLNPAIASALDAAKMGNAMFRVEAGLGCGHSASSEQRRRSLRTPLAGLVAGQGQSGFATALAATCANQAPTWTTWTERPAGSRPVATRAVPATTKPWGGRSAKRNAKTLMN